MTTYIYAVCDDAGNHLKTVNAVSMNAAKEKIIEKFRDLLELDEEFYNWSDFINFMEDHDIVISKCIQDLEAL